jgi:hypothetical protein
MKKVLVFLAISLNILDKRNNSIEKRKQQYINGLKNFYCVTKKYRNKLDILLFDNTSNIIDNDILKICDPDTIIIAKNINIYNTRCKAAGVINMWKYVLNKIQNYDIIIHFEPRQIMLDDTFYDAFFLNYESLFRYGWYGNDKYTSYWTGLFSINTNVLIDFIQTIDLDKFAKSKKYLEVVLFNYLKETKTDHKIIKKLGIRWFRAYINKTNTYVHNDL